MAQSDPADDILERIPAQQLFVDAETIPTLVGDSAAIRDVRELVPKLAESPSSTVLVVGETGTGKSLVAATIHALGPRAAHPLIAVNCSAFRPGFPDEVRLEPRGRTQLIRQADGGTLVFEQLDRAPDVLQLRILRFLEDRRLQSDRPSLDVRVIASMEQSPLEAVGRGRLREDLYYGIAVALIALPPLRQRKGDIVLLANYLIAQLDHELRKNVTGLDPAALGKLIEHPWPGNIRELRATLERSMLTAEGRLLHASDLRLLASPSQPARSFELPPGGVDLEQLERNLVVQALELARGNRTRAGALLGLNRDQIRYRIVKFSLERH